MRQRLAAILLIATVVLGGCGYNQIQVNDEQVNAAWAEVLNQYKRRADLIPNLVQVVQGYAAHEKEVLTAVTQARASVAGLKATPELINDPAAFARFQQAQGELSGALARLMVVVENYPNLKADAGFRDLQAQVEGTENRITVARNRYIKSVQEFNTTVRVFPSNLTAMLFGFKPRASFTVENEAALAAPPAIRFDTGAAAPGAAPAAPTASPAPAPVPAPAAGQSPADLPRGATSAGY